MLIFLLACAPELPHCAAHQHLTAANECADDPEIPGSEDLPVCDDLLSAESRIEVDAGCADDACHDWLYVDINDALGEVGACHSSGGFSFCDWTGGIGTFFADDDGDEVPDADALGSAIFLGSPYDGASEDGLGLGISMGCWVDKYGYTEEVEYEDDGAWISEIFWTARGLFVHDLDGDGLVDKISLFGR